MMKSSTLQRLALVPTILGLSACAGIMSRHTEGTPPSATAQETAETPRKTGETASAPRKSSGSGAEAKP